MNMSFYRFIEILDQVMVENKDLDFRELEVKCHKTLDVEQIFIKKGNKIVRVITLNNKELQE